VYTLTEDEENILGYADILEAGIFGAKQLMLGNKGAREIVSNVLGVMEGTTTNERALLILDDLKRSLGRGKGKDK
jgi:hypothetical protein